MPMHVGVWLCARRFLQIEPPPTYPVEEELPKEWAWPKSVTWPTVLETTRNLADIACKFASTMLKGEWGGLKVGERIVIVGLVKHAHLNGKQAVIEALREDGRYSIRIEGKADTVAVSPANLRRAGRQTDSKDPEKWTVGQVSAWLRCVFINPE